MRSLVFLLLVAITTIYCGSALDDSEFPEETTLHPEFGSTEEFQWYSTEGHADQESTESPPVEIVNAASCAKTKLNVVIKQADFAWTIEGLVKYVRHNGLETFLKSQKKIRMEQVLIPESGLPGSWDLELSCGEQLPNIFIYNPYLQVTLTYNTTESLSLSISSKLLLSVKTGSVEPFYSLQLDNVHNEYPPISSSSNSYNSYNYNSYSHTTTTARTPTKVCHSYQTKFIFLSHDLLALAPGTLMKGSSSLPKQALSAGDDLDLLFQISTIKKDDSPDSTPISASCNQLSYKSAMDLMMEKRNATANHGAGYGASGIRNIYSYSTPSYSPMIKM